MMPSPALALEFLTRRQSTGSTTAASIPDACYNGCNDAALEAQQTGKDPALCEPESNFMSLYDQCVGCIQQQISSGNSTSGQDGDGVPPEFNQWLSYCDDQPDIVELLQSWSSLASTQSALQETISSLGYDLSANATTTPPTTNTTLLPDATATDGGDQNRNGTSDSSGSNIGVIVPAVVVPVVVVVVTAVVVVWALMRRRDRRKQLEKSGTEGDEYEGKAQLHADAFRPELDALDTAKKGPPSQGESEVVAELPAREPVGSEMDANIDRRDT